MSTCIATAAAALIVFLLAWSVIDEWRFSSERIGVYISETDAGLLVDEVEPGLPADSAGLRAGDRVLSLAGSPVSSFADYDRLLDSQRRHEGALAVQVGRNGQTVDLELTPGVPVDLAGLLAQFVLVAAYLGLAALVARYRHEDLRARLLTLFVGLIAIEMALPAGFTFGTLASTAILLFWLLASGVQFSLELHLVSLIPRRLPILRRRPRTVWLFYGIGIGSGIVLAAFSLHEWFFASTVEESSPALLLENFVMLGWASTVTAILAWQTWRAPAGRPKNQALIVLLGLLPWTVYIVTSSVWSGWTAMDNRMIEMIEMIESLVLLIFPASVFLAIFRYGLFDVESFVRRGLLYSIVAALVLVLLYALLTLALPPLRAWLGPNWSQWLVTGIAVLIGVLFRPLRNAIEHLVERGLNPRRQALRHRLIRAAASLSAHARLDALILQLAENTRAALDIQWAAVVAVDSDEALHTAFSNGIDADRREQLVDILGLRTGAFHQLERLRRTMTTGRLRRRDPDAARNLRQAGAEVLVPLFFQHRMIGILCLGNKLSGELFGREEIELLDLFSHQVATSLENLRLFQDATYEELTGLLRREAVLRQLEAESARAVRQQTPLSVAMIDLDRFKTVNDAHGHLFGDRILARVAEAMQSRIRAVDALGRFGGEEFLLVLPDTDLEGAHKLADNLRQAVSELRFQPPDDSAAIRVTVSIGLACAEPGQENAERLGAELLGQADAAVYRAKTAGRNQIIHHAE